jgi:hypothetical protein
VGAGLPGLAMAGVAFVVGGVDAAIDPQHEGISDQCVCESRCQA